MSADQKGGGQVRHWLIETSIEQLMSPRLIVSTNRSIWVVHRDILLTVPTLDTEEIVPQVSSID